MIVYSKPLKEFNEDVITSQIADNIQSAFEKRRLSFNVESEYRAWENSLKEMYLVLNDSDIDENLHIAIEYQIPATSKRVDFIISGLDDSDQSKAIIIELKQWEKAERTSREDLVTTYVGKALRAVTHPSYQAYSYAKTIESYNEYVEKESVSLIPCAYLHNYGEDYRHELEYSHYQPIIELAPIYLKRDRLKLRDFIKRHLKKSDQGKLLYEIEHGKIRPSKALQDALGSMIRGNKEFYMIDEQKVVYSTIKKLIELAQTKNHKSTIIVEGGPGTGKSVVAINLLAEFRDRNVFYVTKNAAPRNVYFSMLRRNQFKLNYIRTLFKGSGAFVDSKENEFDCLLVDEAHRLNEKSGMYQHLGENQIMEIIKASKVSVFFIDEDQIVTTKDFGSIEEIKKQAVRLGSTVYAGEEYNLTSQFRCNGSEGYIAFLDHTLEIRETANYDGFDMDYDIRIYDDPVKMREDLRDINAINNKARMVAGYCYEWITKNNPNQDDYDIRLLNGFKAKWNFGNTQTWAIDQDSFDQVGCIHTSQGLEFDYVGVIIGQDLHYENGSVITDYTKRAKTDHSLKGVRKHNQYDLADRIIRNTYKTLMSRGQKGCFVYCEDERLRDYLREIVERAVHFKNTLSH